MGASGASGLSQLRLGKGRYTLDKMPVHGEKVTFTLVYTDFTYVTHWKLGVT